jgi:uncharacterized membrane protein YbhN (UPF0104 family)
MSDSLIVGIFVSLLGLLGLTWSAHALDDGIYVFGLGLFAFGVLFDFWLVKKHFDRLERG